MVRFVCLVFLVFIFTKPALTAVADNRSPCFADEFSCNDRTCVSLDVLCDGVADCTDGADERACDGIGKLGTDRWYRVKRQATPCRKNQWQCRDRSCINVDGRCDGVVDCPDGSDETFPLCRKSQCQSNWFRCTYGACVDRTAPCNGRQECADNSDELLPRCRNQTQVVRGQFKCANGQMISSVGRCDGAKDCSDGSDETLATCAGTACSGYLFQCAYGACVDQGSDCNGIQDCADGSDESDELCNRNSAGVEPVTQRPVTPPPSKPSQGGNCVLPQYPQYGTYTVANVPGAVPGETYPSAVLNITCIPGFGVEENRNTLWCYDGSWSNNMPKCVRFCRLNKHPSVEYRCISTGAFIGSRECGPLEPAGTVVQPYCRTPNYYYPGVLSNMNCIDGSWDYIAQCKPGSDSTNITITIDKQITINISSNNKNIDYIVINNYANSDVKVTPDANINVNIDATKDIPKSNVVFNNNKNQGDLTIGQAQAITPDSDDDDDNEIQTSSSVYNKYDIDKGDRRVGQVQAITPDSDKNDNGDDDDDKTQTGAVYNKYDIDEGDWRIGQVETSTVKRANVGKIQTSRTVDPYIYFEN